MKRTILPVLILLIIVLTACSASSTSAPVSSTSWNGLSPAMELAAGTLQLAGTEQEVSAEQAKELVILWGTYKQLSQSDTAAQAEIDGLVSQIQENMTSEQIQAISDLQLTQQDIASILQGTTVHVSAAQSEGSVTISANSNMAGGPPDGGAMPPDGGEMPADMTGAAPEAASGQASTGDSSSISGIPSALLEALIQSLEQRVAA